MTVGIDYHSHASSHHHAIDPGDVGVGLTSGCADADCPRICLCSPVTDVDVVTTKDADPGIQAHRDVVRSSCVIERRNADGSVVNPSNIAKGGATPQRNVNRARRITIERLVAKGDL